MYMFIVWNLRTWSPSTPSIIEPMKQIEKTIKKKKANSKKKRKKSKYIHVVRMRIDKMIQQKYDHEFDHANILTQYSMLVKLPRLQLGQDT